MAVATNAISVTGPMEAHLSGITPWQINATSDDASGCEEIKAAPGAGYALVITRLTIGIGAAITVTVGSGVAGGAVEGDQIGPIGGAAGTYQLDVRERPVQLTENKPLTVDASGAGTVCVYAEGFTRAV